MITAALLILVSLVWGFFLHERTLERNAAQQILRQCDEAMRTDARRIRVLRDAILRQASSIRRAADTITLSTAENERLRIELAESRHALAVQIAGPDERMALLGSNVVPIRAPKHHLITATKENS